VREIKREGEKDKYLIKREREIKRDREIEKQKNREREREPGKAE
jgi:hypothetical protein